MKLASDVHCSLQFVSMIQYCIVYAFVYNMFVSYFDCKFCVLQKSTLFSALNVTCRVGETLSVHYTHSFWSRIFFKNLNLINLNTILMSNYLWAIPEYFPSLFLWEKVACFCVFLLLMIFDEVYIFKTRTMSWSFQCRSASEICLIYWPICINVF